MEELCYIYRAHLCCNVRCVKDGDGGGGDFGVKKKCLLPCTALYLVNILEQYPGCYDQIRAVGTHMEAKVVTIINQIDIVGRHLVAILA